MLAEFHRRFPEIELQVEIANTQRIHQALADGSLELGLTEGPVDSRDLESVVFFEDELVPIAPAGHALLKKSDVTARELCREPLLLREEGSGTRAVVERALRRKGITVGPLLSLASPEAIKNAVAAGMGIAIVSRLTVALELKAGSLGIIRTQDLSIVRPLHLQCVRGRSRSASAREFLGVMESGLQFEASIPSRKRQG